MATAGKLKFAALFISVFLFFLLLICFCLIFSLMCFICVPRAVPAATASQKVQFDCQKMCATPSTKWGKEWVAVTPIFKCCQRATFGGTANWRRQLQKAVAICSVTCLPACVWQATLACHKACPTRLTVCGCGCLPACPIARCQFPLPVLYCVCGCHALSVSLSCPVFFCLPAPFSSLLLLPLLLSISLSLTPALPLFGFGSLQLVIIFK